MWYKVNLSKHAYVHVYAASTNQQVTLLGVMDPLGQSLSNINNEYLGKNMLEMVVRKHCVWWDVLLKQVKFKSVVLSSCWYLDVSFEEIICPKTSSTIHILLN